MIIVEHFGTAERDELGEGTRSFERGQEFLFRFTKI